MSSYTLSSYIIVRNRAITYQVWFQSYVRLNYTEGVGDLNQF